MKLQSEGLNDMYASSNIVGMIKSKRIKLVRTVARMKDEECIKNCFRGTTREESAWKMSPQMGRF